MGQVIKADLSPESGLTKAVSRVFEFKAVGWSSKQIARHLYKSTKTIDAQTSAYLLELGVKNTQEAIAKAVAEGWLTFRYVSKCLILALLTQALDVSSNNQDFVLRGRMKTARVCRAVRISKQGVA